MAGETVFLCSFAASWALFLFFQFSPHSPSFSLLRWKAKGGVYHTLSQEDRIEWDSRLVSNFHALLAFCGAVIWVWSDWHHIQTDFDFAFGGSELRHFFMLCTAGYLLYDLMICVFFLPHFGGLPTLLHHVVILVAYRLGLQYQFGTFYMGVFLINEISTLSLNLRWFLYKASLHEGRLYDLNGYLLAALFFFFRVLLNLAAVEHMTRGFYRFYPELISRQGLPRWVLFSLPVLAWVHCLINLYWFYLITEKVLIKLGLRPAPREAKGTKAH